MHTCVCVSVSVSVCVCVCVRVCMFVVMLCKHVTRVSACVCVYMCFFGGIAERVYVFAGTCEHAVAVVCSCVQLSVCVCV